MQNTMTLLDAALSKQPAARWTEELKLSRGALSAAKNRGHLSPAIAGSIAEKLGEPVETWIAIAALESEKDSACKAHMLRRFTRAVRSLYLSTRAAAAQIRGVRAHNTVHSGLRNAVSYAK